MKIDAWELLNANIGFYQNVMGKTEEALAKHKLEVKSFFLLAALEHLRYPAELAKHLLMPKPTVTFLVKRMEVAGYIHRKSVARDLRKYELQLTAKGKKAVNLGRDIVSEAFEKHLSKLSSHEMCTYASLIKKMSV